jgi:hypothetical protein
VRVCEVCGSGDVVWRGVVVVCTAINATEIMDARRYHLFLINIAVYTPAVLYLASLSLCSSRRL